VWKMYRKATGLEIGRLQQIKDFNLDAPEVQLKMKERYGNRVPLDHPVISPVAMFNDPQLQTLEVR
ncbi:MAG: YiiX family permuted papain-like enzyme, partial [Azovibrio sp.]